MTVLSDVILRDHITDGYIGWSNDGIQIPAEQCFIQPASIDMTLGDDFRVFESHSVDSIDLRNPEDPTCLLKTEKFTLHPGEFALASTVETVRIPNDLVAQVNGKSSLGRLGLIVHATAGFVDPGFEGTITLELSNLLRVPIKLYAGMRIAQMCFMQLDGPAQHPYGSDGLGSHYQRQTGATASRFNA